MNLEEQGLIALKSIAGVILSLEDHWKGRS